MFSINIDDNRTNHNNYEHTRRLSRVFATLLKF